jgi:hypothetical protein
MGIVSRLKRLETAVARNHGRRLSAWDLLFHGVPVPKGFDPGRDLDPRHVSMWHRFVTVPTWLAEHGYADALAAVEAGETGPEGLEDLLREQAGYDEKHRAWARIEAALAAGKVPADGDLLLMQLRSKIATDGTAE